MDVSKDPLAMQRLREAAEKAKRDTKVSLPFITADSAGPKHLNVRMTQAQSPSMVLTKMYVLKL